MRYGIDDTPVFVIDQSRCIGCEACVQACMECGTHRGRSMIHLERIDRAATTQTAPMVCMHCEDPTCAAGMPGRRDQADRGRHRAVIAQAALHRLLQLRARVPVRRPQVRRGDRPDDEVRHVPRSHLRRARSRCAPRSARARRCGTARSRSSPHNGAARCCATSCSGDRRCARRCTRWSTTSGQDRSTCSARHARRGSTTRSRSGRRLMAESTPIWRRDFPYEAAGEDEVTRREFARYLVAGAGAIAAGNVGLAIWTQLRTINHGAPRQIVAIDAVPVGRDVPVRLPEPVRPGDPAARRRPRGGRVQPEVHPPRLRRLLPERRGPLALPMS